MELKEKIAGIVQQLGIENTTLVEDINAMVQTAIEVAVATEKQKLEEDVKLQIETLAEETAQRIADAKAEGELLAEDKISYLADKFVADHKDQLVMTEEYHRMQQTVNRIKEAFVDIDFGTEKDQEIRALQEERDRVIADYANIKRELFAEQCESAFGQLTEDLTDIGREKVKSIIAHANYSTIDEYKTIVEEIKDKVEKDDKGEGNDENDNGKKDPKKIDEGCKDKSKTKLTEDSIPAAIMQAYLSAV